MNKDVIVSPFSHNQWKYFLVAPHHYDNDKNQTNKKPSNLYLLKGSTINEAMLKIV